LFPRIRKDFKEKSSIPRCLRRGFFIFGKYENDPKEIIEFKPNDNLDNCKITPCQYFTLLPETAQAILNTPWGAKPFPLEVLKPDNDMEGIIQIIPVDGEWRRRLFKRTYIENQRGCCLNSSFRAIKRPPKK
jgi:hypothetical protein